VNVCACACDNCTSVAASFFSFFSGTMLVACCLCLYERGDDQRRVFKKRLVVLRYSRGSTKCEVVWSKYVRRDYS
jgi:hypothetical protein